MIAQMVLIECLYGLLFIHWWYKSTLVFIVHRGDSLKGSFYRYKMFLNTTGFQESTIFFVYLVHSHFWEIA